MAYCKNCGAYIPDGQASCLACGYVERTQPTAAAAAAAPKKEQPREDDLGEVMERHRQLQQEKNRQWAQQEKERRDRQKENRRWAQEEYVRRQAERELKEEERRRETEQTARERVVHRLDQTESGSSGNVRSQGGNTALAALSYLSVLFLGPFLAAPNDEFAMFHAKQGLRLFIFGAIADLIGGLFSIGWLLSLARIYFIIKGISNALNGKKEPLPYIGTIGKR